MSQSWTLEHLTPGKTYYLPSDIYYIGDVYSVLGVNDYDNSLGASGYANGLYKKNNNIMLVGSTFDSEGIYLGSDNHEYLVDSGIIGITSKDLIKNKISTHGKFYTFPDGVYVDIDYGKFTFRSINFTLYIDTLPVEDTEISVGSLINCLNTMDMD